MWAVLSAIGMAVSYGPPPAAAAGTAQSTASVADIALLGVNASPLTSTFPPGSAIAPQTLTVPGVVNTTIGVLDAGTGGDASLGQSNARVSTSDTAVAFTLAGLGDVTLTLGATTSDCSATDVGSTGNATIAGGSLVVDQPLLLPTITVSIPVNPAPNTVLTVPGIFTLILNKQVASGTAITVTAVELTLLTGTGTMRIGTVGCGPNSFTFATPTITAPASGATTNDNTPAITGTGEPGATITVTEGSMALCTATVAGDGSWSCSPTTPLADGSHTIVAEQADTGGNTASSAAGTFAVDTATDIAVSVDTPTISAGGTGTATITVTDNGPLPAAGPITVSYTPPTGVGIASLPAGCIGTLPSGPLSCVIGGPLAAGASAQIAVPLSVPAGATLGTLGGGSADVSLGAGQIDTTSGNNSATSSLQVVAGTDDLGVAVSVPPIAAGTSDVATVTVSNIGATSASGPVVVTFTPPTGTDITSLPAGCIGVLPAGPLTCTLAGPIDVGSPVTIAVPLSVAIGAVSGELLGGAVSVAGTGIDADPANDSLTFAVTVPIGVPFTSWWAIGIAVAGAAAIAAPLGLRRRRAAI